MALVMFIYGCINKSEFVQNATYTLSSIDSTKNTAIFADSMGVKSTYSINNCNFDSKTGMYPVVGESYKVFIVQTFSVDGTSKPSIFLLSNHRIGL